MAAIEYTRETEYELGPFGESLCKITFLYYPTPDGEDESVEIQAASFFDLDYSRFRDLGREAASNIHLQIEDHLLEWAQERYQSDMERDPEDRAYADLQDRRAAA